MADDTKFKSPAKAAQQDRRAERLAAELRANLKRRKTASRGRTAEETAEDFPADEPEKPGGELSAVPTPLPHGAGNA